MKGKLCQRQKCKIEVI